MIKLNISVDVPSLAEGIRFYGDAFGFSLSAQPVPGVAVLSGGSLDLCLIARDPGSAPFPGAQDRRRYERHWTPVHLDFHVDDLAAALAKAIKAGARQEQLFESAEHGSAAFMSDPFGHGFCLIETRS